VSAALIFDLAWKSAALAALVLAGVTLLRGRSAAERVVLLRLGVVAVFALPLLSALAPALRVQPPAAITRLEPVRAPVAAPVQAPATPTVRAVPPPKAVAAPAPRLSPLALLAALYLTGVAALFLRLIGGVAALALWTRRAQAVTAPAWLAALDRAAGQVRRPRLKVSHRIASPLSWGWSPGLILIDPATLSRPGRADAVLTHEIGHIRRHDWLFLMLSRLLVALLWFNPLIWLLQRELSRQSEHAADDWAVRRIGRTDYAEALVALARRPQPHAALGMAGPTSDLARRVRAVLTAPARRGRPWATALTAVGCLGLAVPLAALEWAPGALPTALGAAAAPTPRAAPTTAASVAALLPPALTAPESAAPRATDLSPDALATLIRQRDLGLAMFEAGARAMESGAAQIRRQIRLVSDAEERAEMEQEARNLESEAAQLRLQARDLAARDPSTLSPMSEAEANEMEAQLQSLRALPLEMEMQFGATVNVNADVRMDVQGPGSMVVADPPPPPRAEIAAGLRQGARQMQADADAMEAEAVRITQDRNGPEDRDDRAEALRSQASDLRGQAQDMDDQAADLLND
jgi:beta-lactamase regulating signal transducer with metallopeptidase domain